jgi:hypothetical protein
MALSTLSVLRNSVEFCENDENSFREYRTEFVESPACRNRAARGAATGVLLGAGLWAVILTLVTRL